MSLSPVFTKNDVLTALSKHVGKSNGARADVLLRQITGRTFNDGSDERYMRKLISELRLEGSHICSSPKDGYYIAATDAELTEACELLFIRAMASLRQVAAMRKQALPDLRGQLRLPLQQEENKDHVTA